MKSKTIVKSFRIRRFLAFLISITCSTTFNLAQEKDKLDIILNEIRSDKIDTSLANKALNLPYDKVVNNLNKCLIIFEAIENKGVFQDDPVKNADVKEKLGLIFYLKGNYLKSSELHQQSIKLYENAGNRKKMAVTMANFAYESKKRNLDESIDMMAEAISILKSENAKYDLASAIDNFGVLHEIKGNLDSAEKYYRQALDLKTLIKDSVGIPYSLNNLAGLYFLKNDTKQGIKYINLSSEIRNKLKDYIGIAWNEYALGEFYLSNNDFKNAKTHFQKSYSLALSADYTDLQSRNLKYLAELSAERKQFDSAYFFFTDFFKLHDSLYNESNRKQLLEAETLFESEKKAAKIKELNLSNSLKENELENKQNTLKLLLLLLIIVAVGGLMIFKAYRQKNKAHKIIALQKKEVERQKHLVEEKQKEVIDSINYAKRLQQAILATPDEINRHFPENFLLYKPKDIVAGDFYFFETTGDYVFYAAADCTGHGVPGALVSVVCSNALTRCVKEFELIDPGMILTKTRELVLNTFAKSSSDVKDGMDISLIAYNKKSQKLKWSGANNPLWFVQKLPEALEGSKLIEIKADKQPIGKTDDPMPFTSHEIDCSNGLILYLFTDGYADQFGGPKGKKFKYKQLEETLVAIQSNTMAEQAKIIDQKFWDWKGDLEQVDDVCIIGIRL